MGGPPMMRAIAYQTGRVTRANWVEVGDVVYYFLPQVARDADNQIRKKLALLWTGPNRVVGKPSESLATLQPMGRRVNNYGRQVEGGPGPCA